MNTHRLESQFKYHSCSNIHLKAYLWKMRSENSRCVPSYLQTKEIASQKERSSDKTPQLGLKLPLLR